MEKKGVLNMTRVDLFGAIFSILFGLFASIFHKWAGHSAAEFQYKILHIRFNETGYQIMFLLIGIFLIICGILTLFRVI